MITIKISKSKKYIYLLVFVYLISINIPFGISRIYLLRLIFVSIRILITIIMCALCFVLKTKIKRFDVIYIVFCASIFTTSVVASSSTSIMTYVSSVYFAQMSSRLILILGQLFLAKIIYVLKYDLRITAIKAAFQFYFLISLVNLLTQFANIQYNVKGNRGNVFFVGLDNEAGKYYICAFIFACILTALQDKDFDISILLSSILTVIEALYRQIGGLTIISFLMIGIICFIIFFQNSKVWDINQAVIPIIMLAGYFFMIKTFVFDKYIQNIVNQYFYGKAQSLLDRFRLQNMFLERWKMSSLLFGTGATLSGEEWNNSTWWSWALRRGQTHNYFIDSLYNYGIIGLVSYMVLVLNSLDSLKKKGIKYAVIGYGFLLLLLRGMFECGCHYIFLGLPAVYYMGKINNKAVENQ